MRPRATKARTIQIRPILTVFFPLVVFAAGARGEAALFLEDPYGAFGGFNPTGHAAVYLSRVCAASPVELRRCKPGERGVVISRYHRIAGYDWIAIPLIPYLYAVETPGEALGSADPAAVAALRDQYRRAHLLELAPDDADGSAPDGEWTQLVGAAYDRTIHVLEIETSERQDDRLIASLNSRENRSHFNLLFHNCAGFSQGLLNLYYPHAVRRSFAADLGIMTPKQAARSLMKYAQRHSDLQFSLLDIPQMPGAMPRSRPVRGVLESFVRSKKYILPVAVLHPFVMGGLAGVYVTESVFDPGPRKSAAALVVRKPQGVAAILQMEAASGSESAR